MDTETLLNVALVLFFILLGGVFAGTEIALISLRESRLRGLERGGRRGARVAAVARDPNRFLAAVQIGVTVAGFFSAAFGAATLAPDVAPVLERAGLPAGVANGAALVLLTLVIAYFSLVLGELVPKRIAMQRSAPVALAVAPALDRFAHLMRPVIWLLSRSTDVVVRALGGNPHATAEEMGDEELRELVIGHQSLTADERQLLREVFAAGDRTVGEVMRPRGDVVFLRGGSSVGEAAEAVRDQPFSRYPVTGEGFDDVLGFVHIRDLFGVSPQTPVARVVRPIVELPATNRLLPSLTYLRREAAHIALVVDEYGGTDGIVTLEDMIEELVGEIHDEYDRERAALRRRRGGVVSVDGGLTIEDFAEHTGITLADGPYETVAGYVIDRLGRLAEVGDVVRVDGHDLVVTEVARRRIARLDVMPRPDQEPQAAG